MPDPINWHLSLPFFTSALLFGYLLGSIPFGLLLTRAAGLGDVREIGSGNIGATNVLRTGNKFLAVATLLFDALKGTAAVLIAGIWGPDMAVIAGFGAFIGHLFPVWLRFRGGKGVATYIGVLLGLLPLGVVIFAVVWLLTAAVTRYSSLAALICAIVVPVALFLLGYIQVAELFTVMSAIIIVKHRANISRLLSGEESRIGDNG
ncbi:glycerol-3-phosphate 1-O-acyltransferase PlsY [Hoeflea prorocentri]|uniref:Glycerol-3-phosphate acyltransferase n=1 Tax=Hoeflea prorocentri TaxID=1922333 RepID=A0A9X3ZH28_9HYPH|nr:glycerol-3-phosphate 1-O-acyltransferase PlsY [Hoeflea prorocentri]MCY6380488.1 glycerol-3-phosphate 1-O-acyltransferase PlsY [Hoeflea prorocentri]MDA5398288.1 glycerol-3-phosphate 1-O-acyltransferase PlsY [Hoeflea prorocentri]